jgi:hypothetical protein
MIKTTLNAYHTIKSEIRQQKSMSHLTKAEFQMILTAFTTGKWHAVYQTKLYLCHSGEYCLTLELISLHKNTIVPVPA